MIQVVFQAKEGRPPRWEIYVEGDKWREVDGAIFGRKPLMAPLSDQNELQGAFDQYEYRRVKGYVMWRLSKQSYHSEQLSRLLKERFVQEQTIQRVVDECQTLALLDDEAWLRSFLRVQEKRCGRRLILRKLYAKGLSPETVERIANECEDSDQGGEAIQRLLKTRYRSKNLADRKEKQKVIASLLRRGFAYEAIQEAIQSYQV